MELTDSCPNCAANPKYGAPNKEAKAIEYCKQEALTRNAVGFFFQQHWNGHEICGFFSAAADMAGQRTSGGHKAGQICEVAAATVAVAPTF
eukprot:g745.t1